MRVPLPGPISTSRSFRGEPSFCHCSTLQIPTICPMHPVSKIDQQRCMPKQLCEDFKKDMLEEIDAEPGEGLVRL